MGFVYFLELFDSCDVWVEVVVGLNRRCLSTVTVLFMNQCFYELACLVIILC